MSHESNAILAINSLDRYTTSFYITKGFLVLNWNVANPNTLVYAGTISDLPAVPTVGSLLQYTPGVNGWPAGPTIVKIIDISGTQITINQNVTATYSGAIVLQITTVSGSANQPISNTLLAEYQNSTPYSNNFTIQSPGALIYGYIDRIIVSQIQLQYNIPTVIADKNDTLYVNNRRVIIPFGYYTPDILATVLQVQIRSQSNVPDCLVEFDPQNGFIFSSSTVPIGFTDPLLVPANIRTNVLKTYRLIGITLADQTASLINYATNYPNFLYTPYIDIYSDVLTNYQTIKDTNTSIQKFKGMVARIYLSGTGNIQVTDPTIALGSAPFVMTADLNNCKVIKWSPDVAVPSIDFQLYDQYSELIPGAEQGFNTEFQITLLCIEGR
jgi:hypothetical protein